MMAVIAIVGIRRRGDHRLPPALRRAVTLVGLAYMAMGVLAGVRGARDLGRNLTPMPHPLPGAELVETGVYRRVRHPLYAAVMLVAFGWGTAMASVRSLMAAGLLAVWLDAKARREEAWLMARFPGYAAYRARTRRFVPGVY